MFLTREDLDSVRRLQAQTLDGPFCRHVLPRPRCRINGVFMSLPMNLPCDHSVNSSLPSAAASWDSCRQTLLDETSAPTLVDSSLQYESPTRSLMYLCPLGLLGMQTFDSLWRYLIECLHSSSMGKASPLLTVKMFRGCILPGTLFLH